MSNPSQSVPASQSAIDNRQSAIPDPSPAVPSEITNHQSEIARTEGARSSPRCCHVKQNGVRCGSPAMRNQPWCYFHDRYYNRPYEDSMPVLEDANALQIALMQVFDGLRSGRLDRLTAQTYIYGLRVAALINRQANFSPHPSRIVLEDPLQSDKRGIPTIPIPETLPSVSASSAPFPARSAFQAFSSNGKRRRS